MHRHIASSWWTGTCALTLGLTGCTAQIGVPSADVGHDQNEMRVTRVDVADGWRREGDWMVSPPLDAPDGASRVGVLLGLGATGDMPRIEARVRQHGAPAGEWVEVVPTWSEEDHHVGVAELGRLGDGAELRVRANTLEVLQHLTWNAVVPMDPDAEAASGDEVAGHREALSTELLELGVVTRDRWGARATRCSNNNSSKSRMAVHYTVTPSADPERQLRGIQRYHMDSRGWCDVGYHFLVGADGTIYEGRPLHLLGSHVGGNNTGNIGMAFIGCFHTSGCSGMGPTTPPEVMLEAGGRLLGVLSRTYGIALNRDRVRGHRDHSGASTSCPGEYVHRRLDDLLDIARTGSSPTSRPTPTPTPAPSPADGATCGHSLGGTYADTACSAGYQCCDGRWRERGAGCGACLCVEESGRTGCSGPAAPAEPPPPPPAEDPPALDPAGASCGHSYGGTYSDSACSAGWQCCDGRWRSRGSCGACACVEESGRTGCTAAVAPEPEPEPEPAPSPSPPAAESCSHSFGGAYGHLACSASYQCCDGSWRSRGAGCGVCACVEETGTSGCGMESSAPPPGDGSGVHAGLSLSGSEIPRAGLSNSTLRGALGISTEPYGDVVTYDGGRWVRGRVSHFGGPRDTGVSSTETGAITGERLRSLNDPLDPSAATLASRPEDYYFVAMRWNYSPGGRSFWASARIVVTNPSTGASVVVRPVDWGPNTSTRRIVDLSPQSLDDLGLDTDDDALVAFAAPGTPLGPVR